MKLTAKRLKEVLRYHPDTGLFIWIKNPSTSPIRIGDCAGTKKKDGYIYIKIDSKIYTGGRLAWLWMVGEWPPATIDHRDGDKSNNRWGNIRSATHSQNSANRKPGREMPKGVYKNTKRINKPYSAVIVFQLQRIHLGVFKTTDEAHAAYCRAAKKYFGEFARTQ